MDTFAHAKMQGQVRGNGAVCGLGAPWVCIQHSSATEVKTVGGAGNHASGRSGGWAHRVTMNVNTSMDAMRVENSPNT